MRVGHDVQVFALYWGKRANKIVAVQNVSLDRVSWHSDGIKRALKSTLMMRLLFLVFLIGFFVLLWQIMQHSVNLELEADKTLDNLKYVIYYIIGYIVLRMIFYISPSKKPKTPSRHILFSGFIR